MNHNATDARLIVILVNEGYGRAVVEAMRAAGAPGSTKVCGQSDSFFSESPFSSGTHDILLSFIRDGAEKISSAVHTATVCDPRIQAITLLTGESAAQDNADENTAENRSAAMGQPMRLIVVIVSNGYTEGIMASAREAGARGGTIVKARGTGTEEDASFFGISLAPEREMLFILADTDQCQIIIQAIQTQPIMNEPGGGIVFTMGVERSLRHNC